MPLTALAVQRAAPAEKAYKLHDQGGLYLLVNPNGSRLWRLNYRYAGRYKTLALGAFPAVQLAAARVARDDAKRLLRDGLDPSSERRERKVAVRLAADHSFKSVAEAYQSKRAGEGLAESVLKKDRHLLKHAYAGFGHLPISDVKPQDVLLVVRKIEARGRAAQRFRGTVSRVFRYAIALGLAEVDPAAPLTDALVRRPTKNHPSPKDPKAIGALMRAVRSYDGQETTRLAILVGIHTFVRPGELHSAEWDHVDREKALWRIPGSKMKMDRDHIVPLSTQVVGFFDSLWRLTGSGRWVFPAVHGGNETISPSTINTALRRMDYSSDELVGHGFRSMASTVLNESGEFSPDWIERQLAHAEKNATRGAYNAALYLPQRARMMQWYSDWLDRHEAQKG